MGRPPGWAAALTGRAVMRSPGRPPVRRDLERAFWGKIAEGLTSEDAAKACGVSGPVGSRWFRHAGGMMPRPLEDCAGCPALAGVRNLGLDDPSAGCPDSHCNSGDRRIRACRAAAPLSQFPQAGPAGFHSEPELPGLSVWSISRRLTLLRHFRCTPGITLSSTPSPRRRFSRGHARRSRWR